MFLMQWPTDHAGCPGCSHGFVELHGVGSDNDWFGRCPNCGTQLFGTLFFTVSRSEPAGKNRLCRITKPFSAVRYHDEAAKRQFHVGENVWYDVDQSNGTVVFNVNDDPWIVRREVLSASIEIPN
jgi:hypothetical protein